MVLDTISHMGGSAVGFPAQWSPAGTGHQCACANVPITLCRLWEGPREHRGGQTSGDDGPHRVPSHETAAAGPEPRVAVLRAEPPALALEGTPAGRPKPTVLGTAMLGEETVSGPPRRAPWHPHARPRVPFPRPQHVAAAGAGAGRLGKGRSWAEAIPQRLEPPDAATSVWLRTRVFLKHHLRAWARELVSRWRSLKQRVHGTGPERRKFAHGGGAPEPPGARAVTRRQQHSSGCDLRV